MRHPKIPSNRSFGRVFTAVFAVAGAMSLWRGSTRYPWMFGLAALTAAVTVLCPGVLGPLNRAWAKLGATLSRIANPVVLAIGYYGVMLPAGVVMRLAGRDPMRRRRDPVTPTYWTDRNPPGPDPDSLPNEF